MFCDISTPNIKCARRFYGRAAFAAAANNYALYFARRIKFLANDYGKTDFKEMGPSWQISN